MQLMTVTPNTHTSSKVPVQKLARLFVQLRMHGFRPRLKRHRRGDLVEKECGSVSEICSLGDGDCYQLDQAVSAMKMATSVQHCQSNISSGTGTFPRC